MFRTSFQAIENSPLCVVVETRATGGVKDDSSDHARAVVVGWTKVCHVHLLLSNLLHRCNRQFMSWWCPKQFAFQQGFRVT